MARFNPMDIAGAAMGGPGGLVGAIVGGVLKRHDVPIKNDDVPATVEKVKEAVADAVTEKKIAVVPVKSGWFSKISWIQFAGPVASVLAVFGLQLSADQIVALVVAIQAVQSIATWVIRTWFTRSVTKASVGV